MNTEQLLKKLVDLLPNNGFSSQEEAIIWTTKVIPLLDKVPNKELYKTFSYYANYFCLSLSADTQASAYAIMKSQLNTAIEQLKVKIAEEKNLDSKYFQANCFLDIQKYISRIICSANHTLSICDAYMDKLIIEELTETTASEIKLLTKSINDLFKIRLMAAKKQLKNKNIEVKISDKFHDSYFIVDNNEIWSLGTSYNEKIGKKPTAVTKVKNDSGKIINDFNILWSRAKPLKLKQKSNE